MGSMITSDYFVTEDGVKRHATPEEINGIISVMAEVEEFKLSQQAAFAAKESAKAKLAALGLTEAEVNAIIGGV